MFNGQQKMFEDTEITIRRRINQNGHYNGQNKNGQRSTKHYIKN